MLPIKRSGMKFKGEYSFLPQEEGKNYNYEGNDSLKALQKAAMMCDKNDFSILC